MKAFYERVAVKRKHIDRLDRKYRMNEKEKGTVLETIKQRIIAKEVRLKQYRNRVNQYYQNRTLQNNEKRFYQQLNGQVKNSEEAKPNANEAKRFWSNIWDNQKEHHRETRWLKELKEELYNIEQQEDLTINGEKLKVVLRKLANWKAPGPDGVHGFWFKRFSSLHAQLAIKLNECLVAGEVPDWMTKGRTVLINYRPITCLPLMWKILIGVIAEEVYKSLEEREILPEEQKGCRKGSKGTNDLLYIDKQILREVKSKRKNIAMGWIDYRKAFDIVPHSWMLECLQMFKVAENVSCLVSNSMKSWKVEMSYGRETLAEVNNRRGIFQGDSFSPLLFVIALIPLTLILRKCKNGNTFSRTKEKINHLLYMDDLKIFAKEEACLDALIQTVRVFSSDIGMEFGIEKCAILIMKRGKVSISNGIKLSCDDVIKALNAEEGYKYLGVLESDTIMKTEMKSKISKEYFRRVRKVLETRLNSRNLMKGIKTWAASLIRYSAPFLDWTVDELKAMDRRTRKLLTMHKAFHPRDDVHRLYVGRKDGGRGLISIEECVENAVYGLRGYAEKSKEKLLSAANDWHEESEETVDDLKKRRAAERQEKWKEKQMHGQFIRQTKDIADEKSWAWLRNGTLKRETESLITAAQD